MKKIFSFISVISLVFVFASAIFVVPAFAQGPAGVHIQAEQPPLDLTGALQAAGQFVLGSVVLAAAATFVVNSLKSAGLVSDSQSVTWVSSINFLLIIGVFALKLFKPDFDLGIIEKVADGIVRQGPGFILPLMPLLIQFSKWIHGAVKGAKYIGTSYSLGKG